MISQVGLVFSPAQKGGSHDHSPVDKQFALEHPVRLCPGSQLYRAVLVKKVPWEVFTWPFLGSWSGPQFTAADSNKTLLLHCKHIWLLLYKLTIHSVKSNRCRCKLINRAHVYSWPYLTEVYQQLTVTSRSYGKPLSTSITSTTGCSNKIVPIHTSVCSHAVECSATVSANLAICRILNWSTIYDYSR